jgi:hypothetical protein
MKTNSNPSLASKKLAQDLDIKACVMRSNPSNKITNGRMGLIMGPNDIVPFFRAIQKHVMRSDNGQHSGTQAVSGSPIIASRHRGVPRDQGNSLQVAFVCFQDLKHLDHDCLKN